MHQAALVEHREKATEHQHARDRLIHQLRASDPERWSYGEIAKAVGLERGAVIWILKQPIP